MDFGKKTEKTWEMIHKNCMTLKMARSTEKLKK
jgi:hypothetical protein